MARRGQWKRTPEQRERHSQSARDAWQRKRERGGTPANAPIQRRPTITIYEECLNALRKRLAISERCAQAVSETQDIFDGDVFEAFYGVSVQDTAQLALAVQLMGDIARKHRQLVA